MAAAGCAKPLRGPGECLEAAAKGLTKSAGTQERVRFGCRRRSVARRKSGHGPLAGEQNLIPAEDPPGDRASTTLRL